MAGYIAAVAETVGAAVVQEVVSRTVSVVLGKRKDKASQGQYMERLTKAVHEVEFVLERTGKMPITEVSLLRDRIELKRDFIEAAALVFSSRRHEKRQPPQGQPEISQSVVTHSSSPHGWCHAMFSVSSFIGMMTTKEDVLLCLSCDDVERFEQFADSARNILRRVESGCSLRRYMFFPCPLVRRLFSKLGKSLIYRSSSASRARKISSCVAHMLRGRARRRGVSKVLVYGSREVREELLSRVTSKTLRKHRHSRSCYEMHAVIGISVQSCG
jgi:hypothetical protein